MSVPIRIANFYGVRRRRLLDPNQTGATIFFSLGARNMALLKECPNSVLFASINMSLLRSEDEYLARTKLRIQLEATLELAFGLL